MGLGKGWSKGKRTTAERQRGGSETGNFHRGRVLLEFGATADSSLKPVAEGSS
jgi:hypothetical protein